MGSNRKEGNDRRRKRGRGKELDRIQEGGVGRRGKKRDMENKRGRGKRGGEGKERRKESGGGKREGMIHV